MGSSQPRRDSKLAREQARVRGEVHEHLTSLGFTKNCKGYFVDGDLTKTKTRRLYKPHRSDRNARYHDFVLSHRDLVLETFADGASLNPEAIEPELQLVRTGTEDADIFRLATMLWSVPVSQGFGRRMRYLVRDRHNGCLIGIFALTDPVFNLAARDNWIDWSVKDREKRLVHVMDAYVVGAVPPYSQLIGGKLVAALMASRQVVRYHARRYGGRTSVISKRKKRARLALLTTTSALGRSSIYNRLKIPDGPVFNSHLSGELFDSLRGYLELIEHPYASGHRFGNGPNWRLRVVRTALEDLGLSGDAILKHGVLREVFGIPLAANFREFLQGSTTRARGSLLEASAIAEFCKTRWIIPRAERDRRYRQVTADAIYRALLRY